MPAHTSKSSIGQRRCSNGRIVDLELWLANDLVDEMAKEAAETCRLSSSCSKWLIGREAQLLELVVFLGKLTHAANNLSLPDGSVIRDSQERAKKGRSRGQAKTKSSAKAKASKLPPKNPVVIESGDSVQAPTQAPAAWLESWCKDRTGRKSSGDGRPSQCTTNKRIAASISERQEAAFQDWWRESRSQSMVPRDASLPSASERIAALKQRLAAKERASSA